MKAALRLSLAAIMLAGVNLTAATLYVSLESPNPTPPFATWDTAATNIQDAVDLAMDGDTVLVGDGVYSVGNREISMLNEWAPPPHIVSSGPARVVITRPIRLESVNGPALTTIEGERFLAEWGVATNGIRCVILGTNATLSGFTLTNGAAYIEGGEGGGVWCASTNAVLTNCTVMSNSAWRGGGVRGGTLYNCTVTGNSAQHGAGTQDGVLYHCVLTGNRATGCGGGADGGVLYNCVLKDNSAGSGGGAYTATLTRCTINGNSAWDGGGTWWSTVYGCVLSGNSAQKGGGACYGDLVNCTVTLNTAPVGGGTSSASLRNCIIYFNRASGGENVVGGSCQNCCTTPLPPGPGNISSDPQLTSASHLALTSPCIGAGFAGFATGVDIDGEPWAGPPAIGADQPGPVGGPLAVWIEVGHTNVATGCEVSFIVGNAGEMIRNVWDFGDMTRLTNAPVTRHAWLSPGVYTVRLTGYNDSHPEGVTATTTVLVREPARLYVNADSPNPSPPFSTWETAARIIQDAVDAAQAGDTVLVTNGVYAAGGRETLDEDGYSVGNSARVVVSPFITLLSVNGPEATTIVGSRIPIGDPDLFFDHLRGIRCVFLGANAVLSGFTLTNGTATRADGAGVCCETGAVVTNCILTGNRASIWSGRGGGAWGGTLYHCTLTNNGNGASASALYDCTVTDCGGVDLSTLHKCTLTRNGASLSCSFYDCTLIDNVGRRYGVDGGDTGAVESSTLYNCTLTGNSSPGWTGTVLWCDLYNCTVANTYGGIQSFTLHDCIVRDNAGGVYANSLLNCVVVGNSGDVAGYFYNCTVVGNGGAVSGTAFNSIFYYNTGTNYSEGTVLNYCCTTPLPMNGVGNITGPPLFMDLGAGDYHLREDSPCIDAGTNLFENPSCDDWGMVLLGQVTDPTDILGNTRFMDGNGDGIVAWDIGAYEFDPRMLRFASALHLTSDGLTFTVKGETGTSVRIERSRSLLDWEHVATVPITATGQTLTDPVATVEPLLFYRAVVVP